MNISKYQKLWRDPAIERRISSDIARHRQSPAIVVVTDASGRPVPGVLVTVEQVDSDFRFGANLFMLDGYSSAELNARYEDAFTHLFNSATIPFYWKGIEPKRGLRRLTRESPPVHRRPPPNRTIDFCERHKLAIHGHTLVWDLAQWSVPEWVPDDPAQLASILEQHVRDLAERYGHRVPRWDVLNEVLTGGQYPRSRRMPPNYEQHAFDWAQRYLPAQTQLFFNEVTPVWDDLRKPCINLVRKLRAEGSRLGGLGLQFHLFTDEKLREMLEQGLYSPTELFAALDDFATLDVPLHISEITLTSGNDAVGQAVQAEVARNFYRLWFSHPRVEAITWWNVPDGGGADGENHVASGLLDHRLNEKPSYRVLDNLIHREWRTRTAGTTDATGQFTFRGFHGNYRVRVRASSDTTLDGQLKVTAQGGTLVLAATALHSP